MVTDNGPEYDSGSMEDEPGAVENRLTLNTNDERWADTVGEWQDGKKYRMTIEVEQVSPGEFEVIGVQAKAAPKPEPAPVKKKQGSYPNPAIENL